MVLFNGMYEALARYKIHLIATAGIIFFAIATVVFVLRMDSEEVAQPEYSAVVAPDMTSTIELVFDNENPNSYYDWAIVDTEFGETFIETNTFNQFGNTYELLLATRKANPEDETYTSPDYMTLTLTIPNQETGLVDVITYIDLGADGTTDTAYLNDEEILAEEALFIAQDQYSEELYTARDYMLDGVSI
jgi:hypothetical protein